MFDSAVGLPVGPFSLPVVVKVPNTKSKYLLGVLLLFVRDAKNSFILLPKGK